MFRSTLMALSFPAFALAQSFTTPALLPGDDEIAASAANQREPFIASGAGHSLVVYEDERSSLVDTVFGAQLAGSNAFGNVDVYGYFLDSTGQRIGGAPLPINVDSWDQLNPRAAWNGTHYLVVFESTKPTEFFYSDGIYGVRVAPDGAILDPVAIRIADDDGVDEMFPCVASVGGRWLVAWSDTVSNNTVIRGAFVEANGVVGAEKTLIASTSGNVTTEPALGASVSNYLFAWSIGFGSGVRAMVLDSAANAVTGTLTLAANLGKRPDVATNGGGFLVAWMAGASGRATPVSVGGAIAVPGGVAFTGSAFAAATGVGAGFDGTNWTIALDGSPSLYLGRLGPAGNVVQSSTMIYTSPRSVRDCAVGSGAGYTALAWTDRANTVNQFGVDHDDLFTTRVDASGAVATPEALSVSAPNQVGARIAGDVASGFLIVYESLIAGVTRIMAHHVDAFGNSLAAPFLVHQNDRSIRNPTVAWNGTEFLVGWHQYESLVSNGPPPLIKVMRVRGDGSLLDPAPVVVMEGTDVSIDAIGSVFLIASRYHHVIFQSNSVIRHRRMNGGTGGFLDGAPVLVAFGGSVGGVAALGDRWLVAWGNITAAYVMADGSVGAPFYAASTGASSTWFRVTRNAAQTEAVISFQYNTSLYYLMSARIKRYDAFGNSPDPHSGIVVNDEHQAQLRPVAAALDDGYLVHFADHRDFLDYEPGISDVYAARVTTAGVVLDPTGIPIHDDPTGEGGAATITSGASRALTVVSDLRHGPIGAYRLATHVYSSASSNAWEPIGSPVAGFTGAPALVGDGSLIAGSATTLALSNAAPFANTALVIGAAPLFAPFFAGTLYPAPQIVIPGLTASSYGRWQFTAPWPAGVPAGTQFWFQVIVPDVGAPFGIALTRGLRATAP
jgi:hypothetical protein